MRILHVIPSLAAAHGGPSGAMRLIERALRGRSVIIETVSTDDDGTGGRTGQPEDNTFAGQGPRRRYFRKTTNTYKVSLPLAFWLFAHTRDYDVIHIHALFSFSSTVAAWAARRSRVPYVIRPLGTVAEYGMTQRRPWLKRASLALIEAPILRHAAAVHFTSKMECDEAASLGVPMRAAIIPLAVEPATAGNLELLLSNFPQLRGKNWVLYLSRLDPKKNVEGLLQAIARCAPEFPEMRWLLAGDGEPGYVAGLHALGKQLRLHDRIIWAGQLQGAQKTAAFEHAQLFVLPSYSENFGIAAAEALQAGLPVVLGKGVALASLVADRRAGIAVEPEPAAIAAAIRGYLLDPAARAQAGANARLLAASEFSLDTMGARLAHLYETIVSDPDRKWPGAVAND